MVKKIVHVNQHMIRKNAKCDVKLPVLTIKEGRKNTYAYAIEIDGPSKVVYSPDHPLSCGAKVWIETESDIRYIGNTMTYDQMVVMTNGHEDP